MFNSNHMIMCPSDTDTLVRLIEQAQTYKRAVYEAITTQKSNSAYDINSAQLFNYKLYLAEFILTHDIEVLDLISRGRSDNSVRQYEEIEGRIVPYIGPD